MANALGPCLALFVLNSVLTFHIRWPTIGVRWVPELSIELAALLLALVLMAAWRDLSGRGWRNAVLGLVIVLALGRYLEITAPALIGGQLEGFGQDQRQARHQRQCGGDVAQGADDQRWSGNTVGRGMGRGG
jgi:hypothetical protein